MSSTQLTREAITPEVSGQSGAGRQKRLHLLFTGSVCFWLLLIFFIADYALKSKYYTPPEKDERATKLVKYLHLDGKSDIVVLGSSMAMMASYRADCEFKKTSWFSNKTSYDKSQYLQHLLSKQTGTEYSIANLAVPGAMTNDFYLILKKLEEFDKTPRLVIYQTAIRDFIDISIPEPGRTPYAEALTPMHRASVQNFLCDLGCEISGGARQVWQAVANELFGESRKRDEVSTSVEDQGKDKLVSSIWFLYKIRAQLNRELTEITCRLFQRKATLQEAILNSRTEQAAVLQKQLEEGYKAFDYKPMGARMDVEMPYFDKLLEFCRQHPDIEFVVVTLPLSPGYKQGLPPWLWQKYSKAMTTRLKRSGVKYIDLDDPQTFSSADFVDPVHMGPTGGTKVQQLLADKLLKEDLKTFSCHSSR
jgi:hypothetical protein